MVETNDEWIRTRTGINERRILKDKSKAASDLCVPAILDLLEKTGTSPEEVDMTICGTITGDYVFPDTANIINDKCGLKNSWGFDLGAACSGFIYGLTIGSQFIETGKYKKVIVIGVDIMSRIINYEDRATCIIFGDGCGAVLLEPEDSGLGIIDSYLRADGDGRKYLHMKAGGSAKPTSLDTIQAKEHYVFQDGKPVFKAAVSGMITSVRKVLKDNSLSTDDVDWLVPHQANKRIIDMVGNQLDIPKEKVTVNIHKYGNTTAGTIPLCLWEWENKFQKGDNVIITAFGGGYTWGSIYLKWAY
jgi:3-oxoacyl-[acyl-carrier-protein] synthase-3